LVDTAPKDRLPHAGLNTRTAVAILQEV